MEVILVIIIFILFQLFLVVVVKTIGRTYLYKYIVLKKNKRTCLKIIDALEYDFLSSQEALLYNYKKIKPLIKKRLVMGENRISIVEDSSASSLKRRTKNLKQFSLELIVEVIEESAYREINAEGLTLSGNSFLELYKHCLEFLVFNKFYKIRDKEECLKLHYKNIKILTQIKRNEFTVIDTFKNLIYPKCVFTLIDTKDNKLLIVDFRNLIRLNNFSKRSWRVLKKNNFSYVYYRDYIM